MNKLLRFVFIALILASCSPALPGSVPPPKDFKLYSDKSEEAVSRAREDLEESKRILEESNLILEKMKALKNEINHKEVECKKTLATANAKLKSAEQERRNASGLLKKLEEEKQKILEAPKPSPTPSVPLHSLSDAP